MSRELRQHELAVLKNKIRIKSREEGRPGNGRNRQQRLG